MNWRVWFVGTVFIASLSYGQAESVLPPYQLGLCVSCHGVDGKSVNPAWPNIGGQHATYLLKQLHDLRANHRSSPIMAQILETLTPADLEALAYYYSTQPVASGLTPQAYVKQGEAIYRGGVFKHRVSACIACHGPGGEGNGQAGFPVVSGQHAAYTLSQLKAFQNQTRHNDLNAIMRDISHRMDEAELEAVAYYMQGLYSKQFQ